MERFRRIPVLVWFLIGAVGILLVGVWFFTTSSTLTGADKKNPDDPLPVAKDVSGTKYFKIVGRTHIASGTAGTGYISNPPTSGNHWSAPAKNGIYDKQLPDEQIIHDLEHGYVWISYVPETKGEATSGAKVKGVSADVVKKLKEIVKGDDWKIVLEPRDKNDAPIALVAWGRLLNLEKPDYGKIKDFISTYRNRGPEKTPE